MINKILTFAVTALLTMSGFTALGQENPKAVEARKEIKSGNENLDEAKKDSIADFDKFKKDAQKKILDNQTKIVDLKIKKDSKIEEMQSEYDSKIQELELKNNELQNRMDGCTYEDTNSWDTFKLKFAKELDELALSIQNMSNKITK